MRTLLWFTLPILMVICMGYADDGGGNTPVAGPTPTPPKNTLFKSSEANNAMATETIAEIKAKADYDKTVIAAKTKLIADLEVIKDKFTKSGDLDEAIKLRDKITALKSEIEAISKEGKVNPFVGKSVGKWVRPDGWYYMLNDDFTAEAIRNGRQILAGKWAVNKDTIEIHWSQGGYSNIIRRVNDKVIDTDKDGNSSEITPPH